jgi:hypothetical protein
MTVTKRIKEYNYFGLRVSTCRRGIPSGSSPSSSSSCLGRRNDEDCDDPINEVQFMWSYNLELEKMIKQ